MSFCLFWASGVWGRGSFWASLMVSGSNGLVSPSLAGVGVLAAIICASMALVFLVR